MDSAEAIETFGAKVAAHDILLRLIVFELQRRDPQFAERSRGALDTALGMLAAESPASVPAAITAKMREAIRKILEPSEKAAAELEQAVAAVRPLTLRRRILNWFERG